MTTSAQHQRLSHTRFKRLLFHRSFWVLSLIGITMILGGSALLMLFESNANEEPKMFLDYVLWSAGTVTSVGYSDFTPQTIPGKLTILFLMLSGILFVWSYMAFLVAALLAPELADIENDIMSTQP